MSNQTIPCMVVDDEPIARTIVANYALQLPQVKCIGQFKNAIEAILFLDKQSEQIILFLDINMPGMSGLTMTKLLKQQHLVIFTTAYAEYAVQSYELDAVDYLLKPFTIDRFTQAVLKATKRFQTSNSQENNSEKNKSDQNFYIKSSGENFLVDLNKITHCEAQKNYTKIFLSNGVSHSTLISISKFEEELHSKSSLFIRIHRSFIISRSHINSIGANFVMIAAKKIPIGSQFKTSFFDQINIGK